MWKSKRNRDRKPAVKTDSLRRRAIGPERLEMRRLFAADPINVGLVFIETDFLESDQDTGADSRGDRFILSFNGGAPDTELTTVRISTDKDGDGISVGDPIFDTAPGGRGADGSHGFQIVRVVTADGRRIDAQAEVEDGGQELILRLSNFRAGDRLEFTLDVDEVLRNSLDLAVFNDRLDVITSGQEFQDSILEATFNAPHFETANADAIFLNDFGSPNSQFGLNLPSDEGSGPDNRPNRSAAAVASATQTPKPIEISGQVFIDNNLDSVRQAGESSIPGVTIALWRQNPSGTYVDTGHRVTTDANGRYTFARSLGLLPGTYQIIETQPDGLFSVASVPGTVAGVNVGRSETLDILTDITIPLGDTAAINYDFAEAAPASLSGFVYIDADNDGRRDANETGIAGVTVRLVPIDTIARQSTLTVTTDRNGSYQFTGLAPGSYEVIQVTQPPMLNDGIDAAGTVRGRIVGVADNPGDRISGVQLNGNDNGIEYNFGETPFGSIGGFVFLAAPGQDCGGDHDADGTTPIPGVRVELLTESGTFVARTTTGADGSYQFNDIPVGNYRIVEFTPDGLLDGGSHVGRINGLAVGTSINGGLISNITMTPAGVGVEYNFCEAAPAAISGFVFHDADDDGRRESGEEAIPGVRVALVDSSGREVATTVSGANGRYEFTGILPGEYSIVETQPDGFFDGRDTAGNVRGTTVGRSTGADTLAGILLRQGDIGVEYNFGELRPATLSGRVHVDLDEDCVLDPSEETLAGVTITLLDSSGREVGRTVTGDDGTYTFTNIVPGTYTIVQTQPEGFFEGSATPGSAGGTRIGTNRIGSITLTSGEIAVDYDFCERPPAEISGSVFNDRDENNLFDSNDVGIQGARIDLFRDGELIATTTTDARGDYRFTNLPAGQYVVRETQPAGFLQGGQFSGSAGGDDSVQDVISRIPISWGERLTDYNFSELTPSSISGSVHVDGNGDCIRNAGEPPLAGVTIELRDINGVFISRTTTDASGGYTFNNLTPGRYQIFELQPDGFFQGGQTPGTGDGEVLGRDLLGVRLGPGQDLVDYNFCELLPSSISGRVWQEVDLNRQFNPGESPIPGVLVELIDGSGSVVTQTRSGADGGYTFTNLAPGVYSVREAQPDGFFHGGTVVGSAGGRVDADDLIVGITLLGGTTAINYDFPEIPPVMISGFVFQDGEAITIGAAPDPAELRNFRDGVRTQDDTPLAGVILELRTVTGLPFDASRALPGIYADGPIRVQTDANGFYEFIGLRPAAYNVYQIQPENFIDGLDTPGTTGGVAVNAADELDDETRIIVQTLSANEATNPRNDAILNVNLLGGGASVNNNFSEIVIVIPPPPQPPLLIAPPAPQRPEIARVVQPIEEFDPRIRLVSFADPRRLINPILADDEWAVSWHLSVINGGFPRGTLGNEGLVSGVSAKRMTPEFGDGDNSQGRWTIADREGNLTDMADAMTLGMKDGYALAGDFDGDGRDEGVVYKDGQWFVDFNGNGKWDAGDLWMKLGTELDRPVVGDWDGDGKDDIGIFGRQWQRDEQRIKKDPGLPDPDNKRRRSADSQDVAERDEADDDRGIDRKRLLVRGDAGLLRADAVDHVFKYGEQIDTPVAGDWNGDGIDQIAIFRGGKWMLDVDGDGRWTDADERVTFGRPGDEPIVGDFNGDEIDEIGVVRGDVWIIDTDGDRRITGNDLQLQVPRTNADSQPVVGDFDGDGKDEPAYYDEDAA